MKWKKNTLHMTKILLVIANSINHGIDSIENSKRSFKSWQHFFFFWISQSRSTFVQGIRVGWPLLWGCCFEEGRNNLFCSNQIPYWIANSGFVFGNKLAIMFLISGAIRFLKASIMWASKSFPCKPDRCARVANRIEKARKVSSASWWQRKNFTLTDLISKNWTKDLI